MTTEWIVILIFCAVDSGMEKVAQLDFEHR